MSKKSQELVGHISSINRHWAQIISCSLQVFHRRRTGLINTLPLSEPILGESKREKCTRFPLHVVTSFLQLNGTRMSMICDWNNRTKISNGRCSAVSARGTLKYRIRIDRYHWHWQGSETGIVWPLANDQMCRHPDASAIYVLTTPWRFPQWLAKAPLNNLRSNFHASQYIHDDAGTRGRGLMEVIR